MDAQTLAKKLGPRLVKARIRTGLSQTDAASLAGIARPDLNAMEKGKRLPRLHQIASLGKVYRTNGDLFAA